MITFLFYLDEIIINSMTLHDIFRILISLFIILQSVFLFAI